MWLPTVLTSASVYSSPFVHHSESPRSSLVQILVPTLPSACNLVPIHLWLLLSHLPCLISMSPPQRSFPALWPKEPHASSLTPITPRILVSSDHLSLLGKVCVFSLSCTIPCEFLWLCCCTKGVVDGYFLVDFDGVWRMLMTNYLDTNFLQ